MKHYKVIIVGGGVAGLYAAWRLCVDAASFTGLEPSDILVLEGAGQTGGRLFTKPLAEFANPNELPKDSGLRAELGGMRFLNYHLYVGYLAIQLGLPYVPFPADGPLNWHYLRSTAMMSGPTADSETTFANQTAYHLAGPEQADIATSGASPLSPGSIIAAALQKSNPPLVDPAWLPGTNGSTLRSMVNNILEAKWQNTPLWKLGFWNLIVTNGQHQAGTPSISNEAYELFADAGAYDTIPANWNAATAVSMMAADFATNPTYYALTAGYEALADTLKAQLDSAGVTIKTDMPVTHVEDAGPYTVFCKESAMYTADNLILALPPRALELITPLSKPLVDIEDQLLQSSPIPLFKIFLVYKSEGTPWWSQFLPDGVDSLPPFTRMTTDLPMRQVYHFGSYTEGGATYSLLQVSYSDALKAGYWAGLLSAEPNQSIDTSIFANVAPIHGKANLGSGYASWSDGSALSLHPLFQAAHDQFVTLLQEVAAANQIEPPSPVAPVAGAAIDWATDPFGGGVNFWNVGVDVHAAYTQMLQPRRMTGQSPGTFGTGGMFIVGEGYSLMQGWVEGALWTVEDALDLAYAGAWPRPTWIPADNTPIPDPTADSATE